MPLGPWKSKFEIHREERERLEAESRRHAEDRAAERKKNIAEWRALLGQLEARCAELSEAQARELAEAVKFRQDMLAQMVAHDVSMNNLERQLFLLRQEAEDATKASTAALFRLIDRFDEWEERAA
jgi:hypothetical protein